MNIEQKAREVFNAVQLERKIHKAFIRELGSCPGCSKFVVRAWPIIAAALQSAVAEEREECCKDTCAQCREGKIPATESALGTQRFWHGDLFCQASAIRARGQKAEETEA